MAIFSCLFSDKQFAKFANQQLIIKQIIEFLQTTTIGQIKELKTKIIKNNATLYDYLKRPEITLNDLLNFLPIQNLDGETIQKIEIKVKFAGYIKAQEDKLQQYYNMKEYDLTQISDFKNIANLSLEAIDKLNKIKPLTLSQASRISGINIEDILKIKYHLDLQ